MLHADLALARRLELAEARSTADFVEARAQLQPAAGAAWTTVAGAYALFDGPASPLTQTFGLGLADHAPTAADLAALEAFFAERQAPVLHEVSPLAHPALLPLLAARGYQAIEHTTVLVRALRELPAAPATAVRVRVAPPAEADDWAALAAAGWLPEAPELGDFLRELGQISARRANAVPFVAELAGQPVATASLLLADDVALLAGASTVPAGRRQGCQAALLAARLRHAAHHGCTLATMGARPGSQSQRNAERHGFRVAYTRTKWQLR